MNIRKVSAALAAGTATCSLSIPTASAIEGGASDSTPWVVLINTRDSSGNIGTCSAGQISDQTLVTAKHCLSASDHPKVAGINLDLASIDTLKGDAVTVNLTKRHPLSSYTSLSNEALKQGQQVAVHGFGVGGKQQKTSSMSVNRTTAPDVQGANGPTLASHNGTPTPGDSGGPVILDGKIAGVISGATPSGQIVAAPTR